MVDKKITFSFNGFSKMYYQKIMRVLPIMYYLDIYYLDLGE